MPHRPGRGAGNFCPPRARQDRKPWAGLASDDPHIHFVKTHQALSIFYPSPGNWCYYSVSFNYKKNKKKTPPPLNYLSELGGTQSEAANATTRVAAVSAGLCLNFGKSGLNPESITYFAKKFFTLTSGQLPSRERPSLLFYSQNSLRSGRAAFRPFFMREQIGHCHLEL